MDQPWPVDPGWPVNSRGTERLRGHAARTVLNSLWPVEDKGTQAFMTRFHALARNGDYGAAWLAARDEVKQQGYAPSVYGAFTLGGAARR